LNTPAEAAAIAFAAYVAAQSSVAALRLVLAQC
jgi:hypothetical protein